MSSIPKVRGRSLFLDGKPLHLRGVNIHTDDCDKVYRFMNKPFVEIFDETDIERLSDWGVNSIRLMARWNSFEDPMFPYKYNENFLQLVDNLIAQCNEYRICLIIDVHTAPGGQNLWAEGGKNLLWMNPTFQDRFVKMWKFIAHYFKDKSMVLYDLLNEPHPYYANQWNHLAKRTTDAIRQVDAVHPIIVASAMGGGIDMKGIVPTADTNTLYSPHYYLPISFTHPYRDLYSTRGSFPHYPGEIRNGEGNLEKWDRDHMEETLKPAIDFMEQYNVPIWVGEFGAAWHGGRGEERWLEDLLELFEKYGFMWSYFVHQQPNPFTAWITSNPDAPRMAIVGWDGNIQTKLLQILRKYLQR